MKAHSQLASTLGGVAFGATLVLVSSFAHAEPEGDGDEPARPLAPGLRLALSVEPSLAVALSDPQSQRTDGGLGQTLKLLFGLNRFLEVGPSVSFTTLPTATVMPTQGTAWTVGGGARLRRPHDASSFYGVSPWIDADALYVRTGGLDRPGFATAAGLAVPLDDRRRFWVGPFARYFQILQGDHVGFDNRDAKIMEFGITLEVGVGLAENRRTRVAVAEPAPVEAPPPVVVAPPDRDHDGVPDAADNCPDVAGPIESSGCPVYQRVIVKPDKLELKDKIAFEWNSAKLEESSLPLLDEVAQALQDNRNFRVQVDGNASSEGDDAHNQTLSEARASAVLDYLVSRGVAKDRLISKGFGSSIPIATNTTSEGRVANRRVEFLVNFIIVDKGNTP